MMAKLKKLLTWGRRSLFTLITRHHFICLLLALCGVIAWVGIIFWKKAYLPINTPSVTGAVLTRVDRASAQQLQDMFKQRQEKFAGASSANFPNLFR